MSTPALNPLVTKVRDANPGAYDDMDDATLTKAVLGKHPEYSDLAAPAVTRPAATPIVPVGAFGKADDFVQRMGTRIAGNLDVPAQIHSIDQAIQTRNAERARGIPAHGFHDIGQALKQYKDPANIAGDVISGGITGEALSGTAGTAEAPKVITDPAEIQGALDSLKKPVPKTSTTVSKTETPQTAGTQAGAARDTGLVVRAKAELGPEADTRQVLKRAVELHTQGQAFEKVFGVSPETYRLPDGTFDMKEFLGAVVKPGTQPPAHVISRVFGSEGVKTLLDESGVPLEKWEAAGPERAVRRQRAAVAEAKETGKANGPASRTAKGTPDQYLQMVGADEKSILKTAEDKATVKHFEDKYRNGETVPNPELHIDEQGNVVGADGRHRALAAKRAGQKTIQVDVKQHPFEGTQ